MSVQTIDRSSQLSLNIGHKRVMKQHTPNCCLSLAQTRQPSNKYLSPLGQHTEYTGFLAPF